MVANGIPWQSLAVCSRAMLWKSCAYFVMAFKARGEWKNHYTIQATDGTALSRFFLLYLIRPAGRIFCSPEQSKLCF